MDIQFNLDAYACASYIVSYISKGQRRMSNLLRHASEYQKGGKVLNDMKHVLCNVDAEDLCTDFVALHHIYTNFSETQIESLGTLESYFSDHTPLYFALK